MSKRAPQKHPKNKVGLLPGKRFDEFAALGTILSALSIIVLIDHAFKFGIISTLHVIVDFYEALTKVLFGWSEPYIRSALATLGSIIHVHVKLYPHWKHVFVLLELYFGSHVRSVRAERGLRATAFNVMFGLSLALCAGVMSGTIDYTDAASSMFIAVYPVAAVSLYGLATSLRAAIYFHKKNETWLHALGVFGRHAIRIFLGGSIIVLVGFVVARLNPNALPKQSGLVVLLMLIILLAIYRISVGAWYANNDRAPNQGWWERFHHTGYGTVGIFMLLSMSVAIGFVLCNAGLGLVGL